jgi:hypothetical protein
VYSHAPMLQIVSGPSTLPQPPVSGETRP